MLQPFSFLFSISFASFFPTSSPPRRSFQITRFPLSSPMYPSRRAISIDDSKALSFQPQWLRNLPPTSGTWPLPPAPPFPPTNYTQPVYNSSPAYFGTQLVVPSHRGAANGPLDPVRALHDTGYYAVHFIALLQLVLRSMEADLDRAMLHMTPLNPPGAFTANPHRTPLQTKLPLPGKNGHGERHPKTSDTFSLFVPGIREDYPRVEIGDILLLRGLIPFHKTAMSTDLEAEVVGAIKLKGLVYVRTANLPGYDWQIPRQDRHLNAYAANTSSSKYQVRFTPSVKPLLAMQDAVCRSPCYNLKGPS